MADENIYVDNERFHNILVEAIPYYIENKNWGKHGDEIGKIILEMMNKIKNRSSYKNYNGYFWEKMQEKALVNVFSYMHKYKIETKNPFNYFSTVIINGYRTALRELNERISEVSYDTEILTELIDLDNHVKFDEDLIDETDKNVKKEQIYIKDEDVVDKMEEYLNEMNKKYVKEELMEKFDGNENEEDFI